MTIYQSQLLETFWQAKNNLICIIWKFFNRFWLKYIRFIDSVCLFTFKDNKIQFIDEPVCSGLEIILTYRWPLCVRSLLWTISHLLIRMGMLYHSVRMYKIRMRGKYSSSVVNCRLSSYPLFYTDTIKWILNWFSGFK